MSNRMLKNLLWCETRKEAMPAGTLIALDNDQMKSGNTG